MHEKLYSLTGTFIKDNGMEQFSKKLIVYAFTLFFDQQSLKLYTIKKEEKDAWVKALKEAIGYSNLYDYYTIGVWRVLNNRGIENAGNGEVRGGVRSSAQADGEEGGCENAQEGQHED